MVKYNYKRLLFMLRQPIYKTTETVVTHQNYSDIQTLGTWPDG